MKDFLSLQLGSIVRNALSFIGGILATHGALVGTQEDFVNSLAGPLTQVAVGLALWVGAHLSSWSRNRRMTKLWLAPLAAAALSSCSSPAENAWAQAHAQFLTVIAERKALRMERSSQ